MIITELTNIVQERHPSTTLTLLSSIAEQCTAADPLTRPTISALVEQLTKPSSADQITDFLALMPSAVNITELTGLQNIDQWRVVPYICRIPAVFWEKVDRLYVASAPLQGVHEHPLRQLCIEVKCHDQGKENTCMFLLALIAEFKAPNARFSFRSGITPGWYLDMDRARAFTRRTRRKTRTGESEGISERPTERLDD